MHVLCARMSDLYVFSILAIAPLFANVCGAGWIKPMADKFMVCASFNDDTQDNNSRTSSFIYKAIVI